MDLIQIVNEKNNVEDARPVDVIEDNQRQHPLLNNVVMDTLFKQYSLLKHDGLTALAALAKLRLVCKTWNDEIGKMVRKQTRIKVGRIVTAYPEGLGWEANANGFNYSAPMAEKMGTFENVDLAILKCADLTRTSIIQWFQVMGGSVKSLRLECPFTCYHQTRFIEKILKEWCPNLRSLTMRGPWCFETLFLNSSFAKPTPLQVLCGSLKEIVFFANNTKWNQWMESCGEEILDLETPGERQPKNDVGKKILKYHAKFVKGLLKYMNHVGEPGTMPDQEEKLLTKLVMRPIGLASVSGMSPATFGTHVPEFFQKQYKCDPGYETDGGVLGQLMKMSKIEKLVIQYNGFEFLEEFFTMFYYRHSLWLSSLQIFEVDDNCSVMDGQTIHEQAYNILRMVFSKLGFRFKRFKFEVGRLKFGRSHVSTLEKILTSFGETLEELEIKWEVYVRFDCLDLPILPKLKLLVVDCVGDCMVCPACEDFSVMFPQLEQCILNDGGLKHTSLFESEATSWFSHPLKVLKLLDGYHLDDQDIERIVMNFPNLKSVDILFNNYWNGFNKFWEEMQKLSLEHVKISALFPNVLKNAIKDNIAYFKDLESVELVHRGRRPFVLTSTFSNAFSMAPKLRFLKFTNFQVTAIEVEEFKSNLPSCVVEIPVAE